jgi:hypothetical protein
LEPIDAVSRRPLLRARSRAPPGVPPPPLCRRSPPPAAPLQPDHPPGARLEPALANRIPAMATPPAEPPPALPAKTREMHNHHME